MPTYATLTIVQDTWFTLTKSPSTELPDDQKRHVLKDDKFIVSYERDADFIVFKVFLEDPTWFVSVSDVQIKHVENSVFHATSVVQIKHVENSVFHATSVGDEPTPEPKPKP